MTSTRQRCSSADCSICTGHRSDSTHSSWGEEINRDGSALHGELGLANCELMNMNANEMKMPLSSVANCDFIKKICH